MTDWCSHPNCSNIAVPVNRYCAKHRKQAEIQAPLTLKSFEGKTVAALERAQVSLRGDWEENEAEGLVFTFSDGTRARLEVMVADDGGGYIALRPFQSRGAQ